MPPGETPYRAPETRTAAARPPQRPTRAVAAYGVEHDHYHAHIEPMNGGVLHHHGHDHEGMASLSSDPSALVAHANRPQPHEHAPGALGPGSGSRAAAAAIATLLARLARRKG